MHRTLQALRLELASREPRRVEVAGVPTAAVALVLAAQAQGEIDLLLIRRAQREGDPWSGHMALPGGRREARDLDLCATARRETREEVGIELPARALLGELDDVRPVSAPARVIVRPFVFGLEARPAVHESSEVGLHVWAPLDELGVSLGTTEVVHLGSLRRVPCYTVDEHVVWGITQRILEPFLELFASARGAR